MIKRIVVMVQAEWVRRVASVGWWGGGGGGAAMILSGSGGGRTDRRILGREPVLATQRRRPAQIIPQAHQAHLSAVEASRLVALEPSTLCPPHNRAGSGQLPV